MTSKQFVLKKYNDAYCSNDGTVFCVARPRLGNWPTCCDYTIAFGKTEKNAWINAARNIRHIDGMFMLSKLEEE